MHPNRLRTQIGLSLLLVGLLLFLASAGAVTADAQADINPQTDRLAPVGNLGGAATVLRLLDNDYACLLLGQDLLVLDVLDPFHPVQVGKLSFPNLAVDLHITGNTAYVLAGGKVHLVDLAVRSLPRRIRVLEPSFVKDIDGDELHLYIAAKHTYIYSLLQPLNPVWMSTIYVHDETNEGYPSNTYKSSYKVVAKFPYLYLTIEAHLCELLCSWPYTTLAIFDISAPESPVDVTPRRDDRFRQIQAVAEIQDYLLVVGDYYTGSEYQKGIQVIALADIATLIPSGFIPYWGHDLVVHDSLLYLAAGEDGLRIVNISNPLNAIELGTETTITDARSVDVNGNLAYLAGGVLGLVTIDVRDPAAPIRVGGYRTVGAADHIVMAGNYLYTGSEWLDIVDISTPDNPRVVGTYPRAGDPAVDGELLFLASGDDGLAVLDISNPSIPIELDLLALPGTANVVAVEGGFAYVGMSSGLQVVDISNPTALTLAGTADGPPVVEIVVSNGTAYLVGGYEAAFYDITDPASPQQVFQYTMPNEDEFGSPCGYDPGIARGIEVENDRVFVIWDIYEVDPKICWIETGGLLVFEEDAQSGWNLISEYLLSWSRALSITIAEGIGYILTGSFDDEYSISDQARRMKLWVIDAANPPYTNILYSDTFTGWVSMGSDWAVDLAVQDDLVVIGMYEPGIQILKWWSEQHFFPVIWRP